MPATGTVALAVAVAVAVALAAVLTACGSSEVDTQTDSAATTTVTTGPAQTTMPSETSTSAPTTAPTTAATAKPDVRYSVADLGRVVDQSLGSTPALGSGCAPGTDVLPDGVWFGWVVDAEPEQLTFDLACLWPGRLEPAASNDASRTRRVPTSDAVTVHLDGQDPIPFQHWLSNAIDQPADNAPGLDPTLPYWLFINDGVVTEVARFPVPIRWLRSSSAWPELFPACCDAGTVAPPSPADPWPLDGWPADGFYPVVVDTESATGYDLVIGRWISCRQNPGLCPEWWIGDEVIEETDEALRRTFPFDQTTTVVVVPIFGEQAYVADGRAFGAMLTDMREAVATQVGGDQNGWPDQLSGEADDPSFPFGPVVWPDGEVLAGLVAYRGPGGAQLYWPLSWFTALEIRDGQPRLYIHAGLIAG